MRPNPPCARQEVAGRRWVVRLTWELESRDAGWRTPPRGGECSGVGCRTLGAYGGADGPRRTQPGTADLPWPRTSTPNADFVHMVEINRLQRSDRAVVVHMDDNDPSSLSRVANPREPLTGAWRPVTAAPTRRRMAAISDGSAVQVKRVSM